MNKLPVAVIDAYPQGLATAAHPDGAAWCCAPAPQVSAPTGR